MLSKLIAKFKTPEPVAKNPEEARAAALIDTPEKAAALVANLETALDAEPEFSWRRRQLLKDQREQAALAVRRFENEAERQRVAAVLQRDKAQGEKALSEASGALARANDQLNAAKAKHQAAADRVAPLEVELQKSKQQAEDRVAQAQAAFEAAVGKGDEAAEALAAESLFQAQEDRRRGGPQAGPLGLRIGALRREREQAAAAVATAQAGAEDAQQAVHLAKAELALVEYDRQVNALLDAFLAQRVAIVACGSGKNAAAVRAACVNNFQVQASKPERILHGRGLTGYNNRYLPGYTVDSMLVAATKAPDLKVLALKLEDLPPEEPNGTPIGQWRLVLTDLEQGAETDTEADAGTVFEADPQPEPETAQG